MNEYNAWLDTFRANVASEVNNQMINFEGFNGTANRLTGDIAIEELPGGEDQSAADNGGVSVDTRVTTFSGFNGTGNVHDGTLSAYGNQYQPNEDGEIGEYDVEVEVNTENGVSVSVNVEAITAGYGYQNVLGEDAGYDMPDFDMPAY